MAYGAALALTEALQSGGSLQVSQSPYTTKTTLLKGRKKIIDAVRTKLHGNLIDEDRFEGSSGSCGVQNIAAKEVYHRGGKFYGQKDENEFFVGREACSGTGGLAVGGVGGKLDIEVAHENIGQSSSQGKKKRNKKLFLEDLLVLEEDRPPTGDRRQKTKVLAEKEKLVNVFPRSDAFKSGKLKPGRESKVDYKALSEGKQLDQSNKSLKRKNLSVHEIGEENCGNKVICANEDNGPLKTVSAHDKDIQDAALIDEPLMVETVQEQRDAHVDSAIVATQNILQHVDDTPMVETTNVEGPFYTFHADNMDDFMEVDEDIAAKVLCSGSTTVMVNCGDTTKVTEPQGIEVFSSQLPQSEDIKLESPSSRPVLTQILSPSHFSKNPTSSIFKPIATYTRKTTRSVPQTLIREDLTSTPSQVSIPSSSFYVVGELHGIDIHSNLDLVNTSSKMDLYVKTESLHDSLSSQRHATFERQTSSLGDTVSNRSQPFPCMDLQESIVVTKGTQMDVPYINLTSLFSLYSSDLEMPHHIPSEGPGTLPTYAHIQSTLASTENDSLIRDVLSQLNKEMTNTVTKFKSLNESVTSFQTQTNTILESLVTDLRALND